jgi:hypothetical protein
MVGLGTVLRWHRRLVTRKGAVPSAAERVFAPSVLVSLNLALPRLVGRLSRGLGNFGSCHVQVGEQLAADLLGHHFRPAFPALERYQEDCPYKITRRSRKFGQTGHTLPATGRGTI